jgi:hypothetical protein
MIFKKKIFLKHKQITFFWYTRKPVSLLSNSLYKNAKASVSSD